MMGEGAVMWPRDIYTEPSKNPFLEYAFKTIEFHIRVAIEANGTWSYEEDTVLMVHGQSEAFHHRDRSVLTKIADPTPNPLALAKKQA